MRSPENRLFIFEGCGIVNETECIHGPRITQQFSPPEAGLHSDSRNVL